MSHPIKTQQQYKDAVDINRVLRAHQKDVSKQARYEFGLWDSESTYHQHLNRVQDLQFAFDSLPGRIRSRFSDPSHLLRFLTDKRNLDEAIKLGLVDPPPANDPVSDVYRRTSAMLEESDDESDDDSDESQMDLVKESERPRKAPPLKKPRKKR